MTDVVLFVAFPYLAVVLAIVVGLYRYFSNRFSYSSLSSQFLESRQLFWGSVPWHYGILIILLAHLLAAIFPRFWASLAGAPIRLYVLEISGLALAFGTFVGLALLLLRRLRAPRVLAATSAMDWLLLVLLLAQVALGFVVALFHRWGSQWYLHTAVPWALSLLKFNPQTQYVIALPWLVKIHILLGFLLIALLPFTRLVHLFTVPITYLWRPLQVVLWNRRPGTKLAEK
ncbi:MAG: respiratory nitrate reductase subunit gamma [Chloroflexota bacterium]